MAGQAEPPAALQPTGHGARCITTSNTLPVCQVRLPPEHCSVNSEKPQIDPWGNPISKISKLEPADLHTTVGPSVCQKHTEVAFPITVYSREAFSRVKVARRPR